MVPLFSAQSLVELKTKRFFPVASPKGDNAGGIAASVIVVLMLIGTLIALLIYYLKTQQRVRAVTGPSSLPSSPGAGFTNDIYEPDRTVSLSKALTTLNKKTILVYYNVDLTFVGWAIMSMSDITLYSS